jgi:hypothetical protein
LPFFSQKWLKSPEIMIIRYIHHMYIDPWWEIVTSGKKSQWIFLLLSRGQFFKTSVGANSRAGLNFMPRR